MTKGGLSPARFDTVRRFAGLAPQTTHFDLATPLGVDMEFLRIFQAAVIVGLGVTATACHQRRQPLESAKAAAQADDQRIESGSAQATDPKLVGRRLDAYFGELFSKEQKALASKPLDADAPSF
jgi:hypothetical protein